MKIIRYTIFLFTAVILLFSAAACARPSGDPGTISAFSLSSDEGRRTVEAKISHDGDICLFLPADTDFSSSVLFFTSDAPVRLDGRKAVSGTVCGKLKGPGEYTVSAGSTEYRLHVYTGSEIPSLFITTESGGLDYIHQDKNNKETGSIRIYENGTLSLETELKTIKGRGNSSWLTDKKSYNIKLNEKTELFGMDAAKKWSLVACSGEGALIKNPVAFDLAQYLGISSACEYELADLYINGEYRGVFMICESVEIGKGRVDISDLEKDNEKANDGFDIENGAPAGEQKDGIPGEGKWIDIPNDPDDITGGYLLELDGREAYNEEASAFVSPHGQYVVVKSPEYASKAELEYISSYYALAEEALMSETGYNSAGKHYSDYFDVDSLARMYLLQEYIQNTDASFSSCFFYKDKGNGKLFAGPGWDFDSSMNIECTIADHSKLYCDRWYVNITVAGSGFSSSLFRLAYIHEDFRDKVTDLWNGFTDLMERTVQIIDDDCARLEKSIIMDKNRWKNCDKESASNVFVSEKDSVINFFAERYSALKKGFSPECSMVFYEPNGGTGFVYSNFITLIGETQIINSAVNGICSIAPPDDGSVFKCWNTERDGSGKDFFPTDEFVTDSRTTILYAQWKPSDD